MGSSPAKVILQVTNDNPNPNPLAARGVKKIITTGASGLLDSEHFASGIEELPSGGVKDITGGASKGKVKGSGFI